jgi:hypothetical protein
LEVGGFCLEKVFPYKTMSWIRRLISHNKTIEGMGNGEWGTNALSVTGLAFCGKPVPFQEGVEAGA